MPAACLMSLHASLRVVIGLSMMTWRPRPTAQRPYGLWHSGSVDTMTQSICRRSTISVSWSCTCLGITCLKNGTRMSSASGRCSVAYCSIDPRLAVISMAAAISPRLSAFRSLKWFTKVLFACGPIPILCQCFTLH